MNFLKNTMFFIIAIQLMVLLELTAVHYWDSKESFYEQPTLALLSTTSTSKIQNVKLKPLTKEKKEFALSVATAINKKIKNLLSEKKALFTLNGLDSRKKLESQAKKFLGMPYVWGATGPNRFDCSGFTQKIFKTAGVKLPRHSTRQAMVGEYIRYEDLELGDMVFFDTSKRHRGVVNHVGIYLEDGNFIHASSGKKKVVITNFNKKHFYKKRFLWGRRVIDPVKKARLEHFSINNKVKELLSFRKI